MIVMNRIIILMNKNYTIISLVCFKVEQRYTIGTYLLHKSKAQQINKLKEKFCIEEVL